MIELKLGHQLWDEVDVGFGVLWYRGGMPECVMEPGTWYRGGMARYARVSPLIEGTTQWKGTQHSILSMKAFRADPPWYNSNASIKLIIRTLFSMDSSVMLWSLFSVKSVRWRCQITWFVYWYSSGAIVRLSTCISNSLSSELWQFGKVVQLSALCVVR